MELQLLHRAENYYLDKGFAKAFVPWLVEEEVSNLTKPPERRNFLVDGLALVGSAEQGFLQMMINRELPPGKYVATSPCFRDEESIDLWHQRYFLKTELIDTAEVNVKGLERILEAAESFFCQLLPVKRVEVGVGMFDLISAELNIELGSYGLRTAEIRGSSLAWVYGTGCAEPRLSQVLEVLGRGINS